MSSLCYLRKLFDKNVASGTSIFSINAREKKNFNPNYASFVKKKKTITKDCRGYNYKKKNAEYEISRKANNIDKQIRAYALVSSFTEFMITQPKAIGGRAIVKWRSITRTCIYIRKRRKKKKKLAEKKKIAKKLETPLAKRGRVDRRNKGGLVANINRRTRY